MKERSLLLKTIKSKLERFDQIVEQLYVAIEEMEDRICRRLPVQPQTELSVGEYFVVNFEIVFRVFFGACVLNDFNLSSLTNLLRVVFSDEEKSLSEVHNYRQQLLVVLVKAREALEKRTEDKNFLISNACLAKLYSCIQN